MDFLNNDIKYLKGVGTERAKMLQKDFNITTFRDMLYYFPFRYVDRSRFYKISEFSGDMPFVQVRGFFVSFNEEGEGRKRRLVGLFNDGSRLMQVLWFSKIDWFKKNYAIGREYVLFGKPSYYRSSYNMSHPEVTVYHPENPPKGFEGVYSLPDSLHKRGVNPKLITALMRNLIEHPGYDKIEETLPMEIVRKYGLMPLKEALREMHFPTSMRCLERARERMKFEELYYLELHILRYSRKRSARIAGRYFEHVGEYFNKFYFDVLPFRLTGAQKRVLKEIRADMKTGRQMNRLLQGDVGSGKTMVAFMAMLLAPDNGYQAALMAPTEILARQHYETLKMWADPLDLQIRLLTGSTRTSERREIHAGLISGDIDMIVGTHALIEDKVEFANLGLVVIDEQHRFGVAQRAKMWSKSEIPPHVLVMTATPIPRTLAMTVYGDLEVSVIDELPPGRKPIETLVRTDSNRMQVDKLIVRELASGRQIYIVYPQIKDNEKSDLKSLEYGYQRTKDFFPGVPVCHVHGQMRQEEKDERMAEFVSGRASILVATTVIEVGVNVPNASVMVIENAERFGLSQLHQLRGRVGRGAEKSYCILMTKDRIANDTRKRLDIMAQTTDGFLISEADMKMRGPGDMEGTQQSGLPFTLRVASLARDGQVLSLARQAAIATIDGNPKLLREASVRDDATEILKMSDESLALISREMNGRYALMGGWSLIS